MLRFQAETADKMQAPTEFRFLNGRVITVGAGEDGGRSVSELLSELGKVSIFMMCPAIGSQVSALLCLLFHVRCFCIVLCCQMQATYIL